MTPLNATTADDNTSHPYDQILVDITSYVFNYEICSPKAFERAKIALLDALGCAFETLKQSPEARLPTATAVAGAMTPVLESPAYAKQPLDTRENIHTASAMTYSHQSLDGLKEITKPLSAVNGIPYHDVSHDQCEERKHPDDPPSGEIFVEAFPPGKTPHPSPYISYIIPYTEACANHIDETFHTTCVYILASGTLSKKTDDLPSLRHAINKQLGEDSVVGIRRGVKPHTYYSDILQIVQEAKDANANCLATLGGGSLTDAAKVVALALANNATTLDELETLYFDSPTLRNPLLPATVPIICIPTSLSAGEYTPLAGATKDITHHKHSFQHPTVGPRLIILSPQLTTTTPLHIWLSTGIRAVDHCVESICSIKTSAEGDAIAEKGLRRLLPGLLTTKMNPNELTSRLACQLGAIDAISAPLNRVPMGASHGIGHQLGPLGVGHGETSCVLLPAVCKYNERVNAEQQRRVLDILWSEEAVMSVLRSAGVEREKSDLGDALDALFKALGMPRTLDEVGIARDRFESLAVGSLDDRWCKTNPIPLTRREQVLEILEMCVKER
ncbi:MAG: hypothetical protein ASARMPREDX12_005100 [Alectoria sarmentosa]|nr:MAG: hypothetical protein ASARMPREDX12_005100 [Alectoria sarmentosa]